MSSLYPDCSSTILFSSSFPYNVGGIAGGVSDDAAGFDIVDRDVERLDGDDSSHLETIVGPLGLLSCSDFYCWSICKVKTLTTHL